MTSATGQVRGVGGRLALVFVMPPSPSHMCSLYSIELLYITPSFLLFPFPSYLSICCSFLFHISSSHPLSNNIFQCKILFLRSNSLSSIYSSAIFVFLMLCQLAPCTLELSTLMCTRILLHQQTPRLMLSK